jgi:hypothetical protein
MMWSGTATADLKSDLLAQLAQMKKVVERL